MTYHFPNYNSFVHFISNSDRDYIIKHRFGADGFDVRKIDADNLDSFKETNFDNYIVQEEMDIRYESRLIFFNGDFVGSRKGVKLKPWENPKRILDKYTSHVPSTFEIEESKKILDYHDVTLGCVDWISVDHNLYYLETNGVATGYGGYEGAPFDFNKEVAIKLMDYAK